MGPNAVWLTESLTQAMDLKPGMRVLDMGCGKALSSIFLAREFGVQVWANDWWIDATSNWKRVCEAGLQDQVFPLHAEAHALPYADGFFDAILSMDAYHYFGTDDLYLGGHCARLLKPGGQIGIIVPGVVTEIGDELPSHLVPFWEDDFYYIKILLSWFLPRDKIQAVCLHL
jgi:cyclopropane fatty-acyl-phospholipid synthase-like methyltransferase